MSADDPSPSTIAPEPRWGLGDALGGIVVALVLSTAFASVWLSANPGEDELSLGGQGLAEIGLWTGLVGAPVLAARRKGSGRVSRDFGLRFRFQDLTLGLTAGVLAQLVLVPLVALLLRPLLGEPDVSGPVQDLLEAATGIGLVLAVLSVAVGAPVVEELFFRGLLLRSLERRFSTVGAVVLSSIGFGLAHPAPLPADALILTMVSLAALAAVLALLTVRTGRLGAAIVAHAVFNGWTLFFLLAR